MPRSKKLTPQQDLRLTAAHIVTLVLTGKMDESRAIREFGAALLWYRLATMDTEADASIQEGS